MILEMNGVHRVRTNDKQITAEHVQIDNPTLPTHGHFFLYECNYLYMI